jgi:hypothetical protein
MTNDKLMLVLAGAASLGLAGAAAAQQANNPTTETVSGGETGVSAEEAKKLLQQCGSRKFETHANYMADGKSRRTGVNLCSAPGDTEGMWLTKLEQAARAIASSEQIPSSAKTTLVTEIHAEIARLRSLQRRSIPAADALVSNVPKLPAPLPPKPEVIVGQAPIATNLTAAPSVAIRCLNEGGRNDRGQDCEGEIRRDTILALESREDMTSPATVRFVRKGEVREEVRLGALHMGQLVRMRLPLSVCKGVVRSRLELELVSSGEGGKPSASAVEGPYDLRC